MQKRKRELLLIPAFVMLLSCLSVSTALGADVFSADLRAGQTSADVRLLQVFLNTHGSPVALSGPGSAGNESDYFGAKTLLALKRFQAEHGLPATGFFGPLTRAAINALLAAPTGTTATTTPTTATTTSGWLGLFNEHAPPVGWIPGFGGASITVRQQEQHASDTTPPSVSVTQPAASGYASSTALFVASASDNAGVAGVTFYLNGTKIGSTITSAPYQVSYDTTATSSGAYSLVAVATDTSNNTATSSSVAFTIDNTAPTVSMTSPADSSYVANTRALTASASDNTSISKVQFQVDGANVGSSVTSSPYTLNWDSTSASDGSHSIRAVATDAAGNTNTSSAITVNVLNSPIVFSSISGSGTDATHAIITWTTNQISTSEVVYGSTTAYGSEVSYGPNTTSHSLDIGVLTAGTYHFAVVSTNLAGVTATSTDQTMTIIINNASA